MHIQSLVKVNNWKIQIFFNFVLAKKVGTDR